MAGVNHCELRGVVNIRKTFPAQNGKKALAFGSIRPSGDGPYFPVKAWETAAEDLGNADGLMVTVIGKLGFDRPKDPSVKPWPLVVVVEKVTVHAPSSRNDSVRPKAEEEPF